MECQGANSLGNRDGLGRFVEASVLFEVVAVVKVLCLIPLSFFSFIVILTCVFFLNLKVAVEKMKIGGLFETYLDLKKYPWALHERLEMLASWAQVHDEVIFPTPHIFVGFSSPVAFC